MRPFIHYNAKSVEQALTLLQHHQGKADFIAGGTDLLGALKDEIFVDAPEAVINIKTIPGMDGLVEDKNGLTLGALAKLSEIEKSNIIQERYGILAKAALSVASPEIRNMGSVGGNLCQDTRCWYYRYPHAMGGRIQCARKGKGPCLAIKGDNRYHSIFGGKKCFAVCPSDMAVALSALKASIDIMGPDGARTLLVADLYNSMGTTLQPDELITQIRVPLPGKNLKQAFYKFRLRESIDFAVASVACALKVQDGVCRDARIYLGAVAPAPLRATEAEAALIGKKITREMASTAAEAAVLRAKPLSRNEFKVQITKTLVTRAVLSVLRN